MSGGEQKSLIKLVIPPILEEILKKLARYFNLKKEQLEYIPEGWDYLRKVKGWNVSSVLHYYISHWDEFVETIKSKRPIGTDLVGHNTFITFSYVLLFASRGKKRIRMLDWGGGIGHYYILSKTIIPDVRIDYVCKDVPVLCEYGRKLFPEAKFYDNDDYLNHTYDFSLVSGSLQYAIDWKKTLSDIKKVTDGYIFVTRLPVVQKSRPFLVLQRAYDTEFLGWVFNREEFIEYAKEISLELVREFLISDKVYVYRAPEPFDNRGFLFSTM